MYVQNNIDKTISVDRQQHRKPALCGMLSGCAYGKSNMVNATHLSEEEMENTTNKRPSVQTICTHLIADDARDRFACYGSARCCNDCFNFNPSITTTSANRPTASVPDEPLYNVTLLDSHTRSLTHLLYGAALFLGCYILTWLLDVFRDRIWRKEAFLIERQKRTHFKNKVLSLTIGALVIAMLCINGALVILPIIKLIRGRTNNLVNCKVLLITFTSWGFVSFLHLLTTLCSILPRFKNARHQKAYTRTLDAMSDINDSSYTRAMYELAMNNKADALRYNKSGVLTRLVCKTVSLLCGIMVIWWICIAVYLIALHYGYCIIVCD